LFILPFSRLVQGAGSRSHGHDIPFLHVPELGIRALDPFLIWIFAYYSPYAMLAVQDRHYITVNTWCQPLKFLYHAFTELL